MVHKRLIANSRTFGCNVIIYRAMPLVVDILMAICQVKGAKKIALQTGLKASWNPNQVIFFGIRDQNRFEKDLIL